MGTKYVKFGVLSTPLNLSKNSGKGGRLYTEYYMPYYRLLAIKILSRKNSVEKLTELGRYNKGIVALVSRTLW